MAPLAGTVLTPELRLEFSASDSPNDPRWGRLRSRSVYFWRQAPARHDRGMRSIPVLHATAPGKLAFPDAKLPAPPRQVNWAFGHRRVRGGAVAQGVRLRLEGV